MWIEGDGKETSEERIRQEIRDHALRGGKVYVGSDSQLFMDHCTLSTVICLHGAAGQMGGRYYLRRSKVDPAPLRTMRARIFREVADSVQVGMQILEDIPDAQVEIHIDVGTTPRSESRVLADSLRGYATAAGFEVRVKPDSWASAIADKHTRL
jgi:predicted RNase H-related nuclease YkuK (DUF458 family)